ncbi:MAG TPA: TM0106 family RecB-like putative nuclease [Gemmatimonadales bacterium]|nr:TM0106 family RecB-like putative nuclease [Gemmatimonadales bacterium]
MSGGNRCVVDLGANPASASDADRFQRRADETLEAMRAGTDVIYQGMLLVGDWLGYPDFLVKVPQESQLGPWSYEVYDAKLSREAKAGALLQVLLYADLLGQVQGKVPDQVHLVLGGPDQPVESFQVDHYAAYYRALRRRFEEHVASAPAELPKAVDPVNHCDLCAWNRGCTQERRAVDHLSFVAGASRRQRQALVEHNIATLEALGSLDSSALPAIDGIKLPVITRIHHQARLQLQGRREARPIHELIPEMEQNKGLHALPEPSEGDLFFDLEGDPHAREGGIEYLFGLVDAQGDYQARWSLNRAEERETFEWFIDFVVRRRQQYPGLHIYHYAAYEESAMKRLAGRYQARIDELDQLLRDGVFVDLYQVVRQGVRASVESYSIKKLEPFYGYEREVNLRDAGGALANFEAWLQLGGSKEESQPLLDAIQGYNRDDCLSTLRLRDWLESLRHEFAALTGALPGRLVIEAEQPKPESLEKQREVRELKERLLAGIPEENRSPEQQGRWLVAQMLEYHRREAKSTWWQYFKHRLMTELDLIHDNEALGGLEYIGVVGQVDRSEIHRYRFPAQEHGFKEGQSPKDPVTGKGAGKIVALDDGARTVDLQRGKKSQVPHPRGLIPFDLISDDVMRERLLALGHAVDDHGLDLGAPLESSMDLVFARAPRVGMPPETELRRPGETIGDAAIRLVLALDHSVLPVQGPPGSGKTYTGARMILALLAAGKKVGVTATSHKVISNLLREVCETAQATGQAIAGIQKADEDDWCEQGEIVATTDNGDVVKALASGEASLAAGTAWLWSRPDMTGSVDVLFIDEAGQFSLANALAVAPAASSLVLLGDPRQLQQPQQGIHPPGADLSALDHLLQGRETMSGDRGLFLDRTWRLHPEICEFTSAEYYQGRLQSEVQAERHRLGVPNPYGSSGLRWLDTPHTGNASESVEEVARVVETVNALVKQGMTWTDRDGTVAPITLNDVLIVAPYNAQVDALKKALPGGARVGTVDKFQGQQAPVVIYSLTSSSPADAPRGMEFLYSPNRLNVATSRAKCLALLVSTDQVFLPECWTPEQMRLANGLCRYLEHTK